MIKISFAELGRIVLENIFITPAWVEDYEPLFNEDFCQWFEETGVSAQLVTVRPTATRRTTIRDAIELSIKDASLRDIFLEFESEDGAMLFKLTWL